jgi:hypothetical protein
MVPEFTMTIESSPSEYLPNRKSYCHSSNQDPRESYCHSSNQDPRESYCHSSNQDPRESYYRSSNQESFCRSSIQESYYCSSNQESNCRSPNQGPSSKYDGQEREIYKKKICGFFNTIQGCKNGIGCNFVHDQNSDGSGKQYRVQNFTKSRGYVYKE